MPLIQADGTELNYDLTGPAGAPVVVFSNSVGTTLDMWDGQGRALAERYRCLRYDTRGHGRSSAAARGPARDGLLGSGPRLTSLFDRSRSDRALQRCKRAGSGPAALGNWQGGAEIRACAP